MRASTRCFWWKWITIGLAREQLGGVLPKRLGHQFIEIVGWISC
jgi:hypothetical protein